MVRARAVGNKRISNNVLAVWVVGIALSIPTHLIAWSWFMASGPDLIGDWSRAVVSDPTWLTSVLYFPLTLLVVVGTEFISLFPLNLLILLMVLWRRRAGDDRTDRHIVRL